jgi:hypothetical protein
MLSILNSKVAVFSGVRCLHVDVSLGFGEDVSFRLTATVVAVHSFGVRFRQLRLL